MKKYFNHIVDEQFKVKSWKDARKKVNRIIVSYTGEDFNEYRKSFEFPKDTRNMHLLVPKEL